MKRTSALATALLAVLLTAPATHAGAYHVYSCTENGRQYVNSAWKATVVAGVTTDSACGAGGTLSMSVPAGTQMADATEAALFFTSPSGTTIADFTLTRQIGFNDPTLAGTHRYYALYSLGATPFAGAGDYADATRNALNAQGQWYGFPEANVSVAKSTVSLASFPALRTYTGLANQLFLRVGCFARGTPCSVGPGGAINHILHGSDITVNDPTPPVVSVEAAGLLAGGPRSGSDPVTLTATDGAGIRTVELLDVTTGTPVVVGAQDFSQVPANNNKVCDYSQPAPCPQLARQTIVPSSLPSGNRSLIVSVTDTGGNVVQRGPYPVFAVTPSDRGAANGTNATDSATLYVSFTATKATHRTLSYGTHAGIRGKLVSSTGLGIGGAKLMLLTRDLRRDASVVARATITTRADGSFSTSAVATASRLLQFAWIARANDVRFGANGYLTLNARASSTLRSSTRHPQVGRSLTVSGQLRGVSRGGVTVVVQGRPRGGGPYETFADTTTSPSGRFKVRYRFRSAGSRGRQFVFRARIRPAARFPYETGYSNTVTVRVR